MTKILSFLTLVFLILSCESLVKVDIPQRAPQLVLNSFFNPDSSWRAVVEQSQFILDDEPFKSIEGARVSIWEGDQEVAVMEDRGNGLYQAREVKPDPEKTYRIRAEASGFESAESTDKIPSKVPIIAVNGSPFNSGSRFKVTFQDPQGEENFYSIALYSYNYITQYNETTDSLEVIDSVLISNYLYSDDPIIEDFDDYSTNNGLLFKDVAFEGKEYEISFILEGFCCSDFPSFSSDTFVVVLNNVSEAFYLYNITADLQDHVQGDPFAEPVQIFNNIENGYGIFAGYHADQQLFEIDP